MDTIITALLGLIFTPIMNLFMSTYLPDGNALTSFFDMIANLFKGL